MNKGKCIKSFFCPYVRELFFNIMSKRGDKKIKICKLE